MLWFLELGYKIILVNKSYKKLIYSKRWTYLHIILNIASSYVHPYVVSSLLNVRLTNLQAYKRERWACQDQCKVYRNTAFSCKQMSARWGTDENQIGGSGGAVISENLSEAAGIQNRKSYNQQQTIIIFYSKTSVIAILISQYQCVVKRSHTIFT